MSHREEIEKNGYYIFDLTKNNDEVSITPISLQYQVIMLCQSGEATFESNMQQLTLGKDDCLFLNNVLYKKTLAMSDDFRAKVMICSRDFVINAIIGIPIGYIELMYLNPIATINDPTEKKILSNFLDTLYLLQDKQLGLRHYEITHNTFRSLILLMAGIRIGRDTKNLTFSHSDIYFRQFIELIETHVKQEHEVAFYASQLNITAKYLSEVCKAKSGHKAKEMISLFLISKIKQEIAMTGKSIKTIAYEYGFADQSSMGKFFNKMTGKSPGDFKKALNV